MFLSLVTSVPKIKIGYQMIIKLMRLVETLRPSLSLKDYPKLLISSLASQIDHLFLICFYPPILTFVRYTLHRLLGIQIMLFCQLMFPSVLPQLMSLQNRTLFSYEQGAWEGFRNFVCDIPLDQLMSLKAEQCAKELSSWIQAGIASFIPLRKFRLNSSPWFSPACAAAIAHRNH